jgi:hypothetical protein
MADGALIHFHCFMNPRNVATRFMIMMETYEGRLKSSWTDGSAPMLCFPPNNRGAGAPVHEIYKRPW